MNHAYWCKWDNNPYNSRECNCRCKTCGSELARNRRCDNCVRVEVEEQRVWFESHKRQLNTKYRDRYVAVYRKTIIDSDPNISDLINRFFSKYGNVAVYFGYTGEHNPTASIGGAGMYV